MRRHLTSVVLIAGLNGCSRGAPTKATRGPAPASAQDLCWYHQGMQGAIVVR